MKKCVLEDKECIECGKCEMCDLDPTKVCTNCCKCIESDADYKELVIEGIIDENSDEDADKQGLEEQQEPIDPKLLDFWEKKLKEAGE